MHISNNGITLICASEGFSSIPYPDVAGKKTIGYGHLIRPTESFISITEEQAREILAKDLNFAESCINFSVHASLTQNQYDALVSLVFNIGVGNFMNSTLLKDLNSSMYQQAADQFLAWNHSGGVVISGLTHRRQAERSLFLT